MAREQLFSSETIPTARGTAADLSCYYTKDRAFSAFLLFGSSAGKQKRIEQVRGGSSSSLQVYLVCRIKTRIIDEVAAAT